LATLGKAVAKTHEHVPADLMPWIEARRRFRLSHAQVQMARELGMNPKKLGKMDDHHQKPWKLPLPEFIEGLYFRRFGREMPIPVRTIEEIAAARRAKKQAKKAKRMLRPEGASADAAVAPDDGARSVLADPGTQNGST
jgi:hypothetical protein